MKLLMLVRPVKGFSCLFLEVSSQKYLENASVLDMLHSNFFLKKGKGNPIKRPLALLLYDPEEERLLPLHHE